MPSKSTFALVALLAATSVSALPTPGSWVDLVERGPGDTPVAAAGAVVPANTPPAVVPPTAALAQSPVSAGSGAPAPVAGGTGPHHHQLPHHHPHPNRRPSEHNDDHSASTHGHGHGHPKRHPSHDTNGKALSTDGTTTPRRKHRHRHSSSGSAVTPPVNSASTPLTPPAVGNTVPVTPSTPATTLSRREFYESLYPRDPPHHHHPHHHHHHHQHPQPVDQQQVTPQPDPSAAPPVQTREFIERRGLLETLGLKARVASLTVKQSKQLEDAKAICAGLLSKKDQHTCHKTVDKIIQLTKERNYDVQQFIKITNHHDVFTASDPSLSSSSTGSHSH